MTNLNKILKLKFMLIITILIVLISCSDFINKIDHSGYEVINTSNKDLSIIFAHNVNGETHPCGCRHFPLGGLPQVAGQLKKIRSNNNTIYIDTGDLFYPSSVIPASLKKSLNYSADTLLKAMNQLHLDYFVPGDQDFAGGLKQIQDISKKAHFKFLVSNLKDEKILKHKRWVQINNGASKIFLIGIVNPEVINDKFKNLFTNPITAIKKSIKEIKQAGFNSNNKFHRLIILSHSGIDYDEKIAKDIKNIDWIVGAHSQSFIRDPIEVEQTKLVQVLSRNHYLGEIVISSSKDKLADKYNLLEMRTDKAKFLSPNPFFAIIDEQKNQLSQIQSIEQNSLTNVESNTSYKLPTAASCIECHQKQGNFWMHTPHSLAYSTLLKVKEEKNSRCIQCHSVGFNKENGFFRTKDILYFSNQKNISPAKLKILHQKYRYRVKKIMKDVVSVRLLSKKKIYSKSKRIFKLNETLNIANNFSNVQCLNCHAKTIDHPFETNKILLSRTIRFQKLKSSCLSCHTKDQSISWYKTNKKGVPGNLDETKFFEYYKKMACPKLVK